MKVLVDTSGFFALLDRSSREHSAIVQLTQKSNYQLILPITILPEACYLILTRMGHAAMRRVLSELSYQSPPLETIQFTDLAKISGILQQYADAELDFVDASIIALAERLNITHILTLDRRDFSLIKPEHCDAFILLP
ncbi:MAG: PIN domain-containing protein [Anaerolineae bacterium]|nr:PIN domain-containing protein [Anaerolineae bacterium]